MEINLSDEIINTIYNSLRNSKTSLKRQLENSTSNGKINHNKKEITEHQLIAVENALQVFEELMDNI